MWQIRPSSMFFFSEVEMIEVRVKDNETLERILKRFKRKVEREGILKEVRRRRHYLKPSEEKRRKRREAEKRRKKKEKRRRQAVSR